MSKNTRGGAIELSRGSVTVLGLNGSSWSSTASTDISNAHNIVFGITDTYPSFSNARWYGFSIRCVTTGFTRGGGVYLGNGAMCFMGRESFYWSSVASTNNSNAYYFNFRDTSIYLSNSNARWYGFFIRCVTARSLCVADAST